MSGATALLLLSRGAMATNSSSLEGWKLGGDSSRSSWDIVWGCLTTILACTWTALHVDVPHRRMSSYRISVLKLWAWFVMLLGPEMTAWLAGIQLWQARSTREYCNAKQAAQDEATHQPKSWLHKRSSALSRAPPSRASQPSSEGVRWTLDQAYCLVSNGVVIQTEDDWIYTIPPMNIKIFIDAGLISCIDIRKRDIDDRAKADSLAKLFTVVQSTWTMVNIVARAAYNLPISLIELATVAYVACGICTYIFWWHKAKDMTTPITIPVPYTRNNLSPTVAAVIEEDHDRWIYLRAAVPEEDVTSTFGIIGRIFTLAVDEGDRAPRRRRVQGARELSLREKASLDFFALLCGLVFTGIHVAAWDFEFPTKAEKIAWRVFSLVAIAMLASLYTFGQVPYIVKGLRKLSLLPSSTEDLEDWNKPQTRWETYGQLWTMFLYMIGRLGLLVLIFAQLRALPIKSYISIDWLTILPHV